MSDLRVSLRMALALLLAALVLLLPAHALAHGGIIGAPQTFTQSVGPYELTIGITIPQSAPAPLYLTITPSAPIGDATIALRAAPRGQSFASAPGAELRTNPPQPSYNAQLEVDRAGDWDLEVRVAGPRGSGAARIPFTVVIPALSLNSILLLAAIGGVVGLMALNIALEGVARARQRPLPVWVNGLLGQAIFVCVILATVFGVQQFLETVQSAQAAVSAATLYGRPHVNVALRPAPVAPVAGQPLTLTLDLSDGSTGLPVEDLSPHHEALMHLVVIDASGGYFAHLHPGRIAPGRFVIDLTPDRPGRYTAYLEIERQDSGVQMIARDFAVGGVAAVRPAPPPGGLGIHEIDGLRVDVRSSQMPLRAGRQATLTFSMSAGGTPVADMEPWLGMAGHLIARSADGAIYGHIHAAEPLPTLETLNTVRYGPDIRFVYTFPQPGRYQLWGQFRRNGAIITVPLMVEVEG
ncbi:MAG: hypothetical protein ACJ8CR_08800 [Roseiflexaceae bacterium]